MAGSISKWAWSGLGVWALAASTQADYRDDIRFTQLKAELGASLPTGAGVSVMQVELATPTTTGTAWSIDSGGYAFNASTEFSGKTITPRSASYATDDTSVNHASTVAQFFYGNSVSTAPGITTVDTYEVNNWLVGGFLNTTTGYLPLNTSTVRIANHSWVGTTGTTSLDLEVLHRLDYVVQREDMIQVVGVNNPGGSAQSLLSSSFNSIAVGLTNGNAASGTTALDSLYTSGRTKPDIVAPHGSWTSLATPMVSAAAALLVQTGHNNASLSAGSYVNSLTGMTIRNAETPEVVKAALMAGADRSVGITNYRAAGHQTSNGLDDRYGAGELDIYNSYHIIAGGETDAGGTIAGSGFDYASSFSKSATATYSFTGTRSVSGSLVWNAFVNSSLTATLANFDLQLYQVGNLTPIASSTSTGNNTENIFWSGLDPHLTYQFKISRTDSLGAWDYGFAWVVPEPGSLSFLCAASLLLGRRRRV